MAAHVEGYVGNVIVMAVAYDAETALVVVDVQNDFADPAGSLSVPGADRVIDAVNNEIGAASAAGAPVVYTQDWHPARTPALRHRRWAVAGALRRRHLGRRAPPPAHRERPHRAQGDARRGRLLRLHDARRQDGHGRPDRTRRAAPPARHEAGRRRRAGPRLLRQGHRPRRREARLRDGGAHRRHRPGRGHRGRRRQRRGRARRRRRRCWPPESCPKFPRARRRDFRLWRRDLPTA